MLFWLFQAVLFGQKLFNTEFPCIASNNNLQLTMESLISLPDFIKKDYDPFASPPDYQLALQHRKATLVGLSNNKTKSKQCECCMLPINKQLIDLRCNHAQLSFLGTSFVMYFNLLKVSIILLTLIAMPLLVLQGILLNKNFVCCQISSQLLISLDMRANQPACFIITGWILITGLAYLTKRYFQHQIYIIQIYRPNQEDYTLKLSNLPYSDQEQITKMVQLCLGQKVASLELAFDIKQMHEAFLKRQKLTMQRNKLDKAKSKYGYGLFTSHNTIPQTINDDFQLTELNKEINLLDQTLNKYKHYITFTPYKQIGVAFVSFETKSSAEKAFMRYQQILAVNKKRTELTQANELKIEKALNPKDLVWQNLNCENKKINLFIQTCAIIIGLLILFLLGVYLKDNKLREKMLNFDPKLVQFFIIFTTYCLFHALVRLLVSVKNRIAKYSTYTYQHISSFKIYLVLNTIFACTLPFMLHFKEDQLLLSINFVALIDAFIHPFIKICSLTHIYQQILGQYIQNLQPSKNYYTQSYLNRLFQGRQFTLGENCHYNLRALFVLAFFSFAAPLVILYYILALILEYLTQKVLLLRACKKPPKISKSLVSLVVRLSFYLPTVFLLGVFTLIQQSNRQISSYWILGILLFLSLVFIQFSQIQDKKHSQEETGVDLYYLSKSRFSELYQNQNPIRKYDGTMYSSKPLPAQKIFSSPECQDFQFFQSDESKKEIPLSQIRSINRLMSYNNDLSFSSQYKRLCNT